MATSAQVRAYNKRKNARWRAAHPDYQRLWRLAHRAQSRGYTRKWYIHNRARAAATHRRWLKSRPDYEARIKREWRASHRAESRRRAKQWRAQHPGYFKRIMKLWTSAHPTAQRAHGLVKRAIRSGALVKMPCAVCGTKSAIAHHDDYRRPLAVMWLCPVHHKARHRIRNQH